MSPLPLPPVAAPYQLPFHYGALHNIGLDYLVGPDPVREVLAKHHPALTAADFDGQCLVSLNYQLYFAQYQFGGGITQEVEVNIVAYPTAARPQAWAAGSPILCLRLLLGLHPDPSTRSLATRAEGETPEWLGGLTLQGVAAFGKRFDVRIADRRIEVTPAA